MSIRLAVFFIFANLFGLLTRSVAWDSRLWFTHIKNQDIDALYWFLNQAKLTGQFQLFSFLSFFKDPVAMANGISFCCWLLITLFFYWFVTELKLGSPLARTIATTCVAIKPSFLVGYEFCHMPYSLGILLYFAGVWGLLTYGTKLKSWPLIFFSVALFVIWDTSFTLLRSIMFLHYGIIVMLYLNKNIHYKQLAFLAAIPLVSWFLKADATGVYGNYNQVKLANISLWNMAYSLKQTNWIVFRKTTGWIWKNPGLFAIFILAIPMIYYGLLHKVKLQKSAHAKIMGMPFIIWSACCGFFILFLIFPYVATGIAIQYNDFESRHAILHFFPQALFLLGFSYFLEVYKTRKLVKGFFTLIIAAFLVAGLENQRRWMIDGFVQDSMIENLRSLPFDRSVSVLLFEHKAVNWHHLDRRPNIYEFNGLLDAALDEQKWVGIERHLAKNLDGLPQDILEHYACKNCKVTDRRQVVEIDKGDLDPFQWTNFFSLLYSKYFDKDKYQMLAKSLLSFKVN